jgi:opacity protein-like surface antigen
MTRFGRLVMAVGVVWIGLTGAAWAQSNDHPFSAQGTFGVTFGPSDGTFSGEFGFRLSREWELFFEAGQMHNVVGSLTEDRAQIVADEINGSTDPVETAAFYDGGVKYLLVPFGGGYTPYIGIGSGVAHVTKNVTFSVNGTELTEQQLQELYGVQLGNDLAGSTTKGLFVVAVGVSRNFAARGFLDFSYRYGVIFSKTGTIDGDEALNTNRLQLGVGIRF